MSPTPDPTAGPAAHQLDLFADSREQRLRNDLAAAVSDRQAPAARRALAALRDEAPGIDLLEAGHALVTHLEATDGAPFSGAQAALQAREALAGPLREAARQVLGPAADGWLRADWARLARRAAGLAYDARHQGAHAASLWREAEDWPAMAQSVEGIESWRRQTAPLGWMALARARAAGVDAAWPLLCELAWLAPARLRAVVQAVPDHALQRLWRRFEADFDDATLPDAAAWWPAWLLVEQPLLLQPMDGAQPGAGLPPEQAWQTLRSLLRLERQGRQAEIMVQRQRLRALHEGLFAAYLRQR